MNADVMFFVILVVLGIVGNIVMKKIDPESSKAYLLWSIFICFLGGILLYSRLM